MSSWQGLLNTNYWIKCYQKVKSVCELFHCTNVLIRKKKKGQVTSEAVCLKKMTHVKNS